MYKLQKDRLDNVIVSVLKLEDGASIPFDPDNRDAEEFALWLKSGNMPEPAEAGQTVTPEWIAETIAKLLSNA